MVFTTNLRTPIEPRNLNRHLDRMRTRAGVPRIRFHDLRHSCATLPYDQGVSLDCIQDMGVNAIKGRLRKREPGP